MLDNLFRAMDRAVSAEAAAARPGFLQRLDPRVKVVGLLALVAAVAFAHNAAVLTALLAVALLLALWSRLPARLLLSGIWVGALAFGVALAAPALVLTPGRVVWRLPGLGWAVTAQGLAAARYLLLRVITTATLGFVLVFTTRWAHVLKALRALRVPVVFVAVLGMTYRYILLLLETAHQLFEGRRSRTVGRMSGPDRRRLAVQGTGALLSRALDMSGEVYLAMQARGFRGEVYLLDDFRMTPADWVALGALVAAAGTAVWMGR
jgi:cobalt ECF transporter T component CbiQ